MILSSGPAGASLLWPWFAGAVALLGYVLALWSAPSRVPWPAAALTLGWLAHALSLVLDIIAVGDTLGPRFGFAPALSVTVWLVLGVHAVESRFVPLPGVRRALALAGALVVLLTAAFPGEVRVQVGSPWLPLHWLLGVASYGLFGAAVLHATLLDAAERRLRSTASRADAPAAPLGLPLLRLERLTFRFVDAGFAVLSAALLLGLWSTVQWRWDHKTVFSLLGWATLAALMVGRHWLGWRGRRATRWLYAGAVLLLLAYIGSRFVLEVLLMRAV
jgi:ABC-type uncharacterized transport system permease subunit